LNILLTGIAGFIGMHIGKELLNLGYKVIGIDNLNSYYDINLKKARLNELNALKKNFIFKKIDISDNVKINELFSKHKIDKVLHLAAQAGVRFSITNPHSYIESNISGFINILEACKNFSIKHFVFASSSSVYGNNTKVPFLEKHNTDYPLSLYGATKKSNELIAHVYSSMYELPITGLRFFTVYGPWGRPDMAPFIFTKSILSKKPINVFNSGNMIRDFTYIDDVTNSLLKIIFKPPVINKNLSPLKLTSSSSNKTPFKIFNIGNSSPIRLTDFIKSIEVATGKKAILENQPMQPGDVKQTFASTIALEKWISIKPSTNIDLGIQNFVKWYRKYYSI